MQFSNDSDAMWSNWVHKYMISMRPTYSAPVHLLTYLHSGLWAYKTGNISETVEDRVKVAINGLYKIVHRLSITAKMYDFE